MDGMDEREKRAGMDGRARERQIESESESESGSESERERESWCRDIPRPWRGELELVNVLGGRQTIQAEGALAAAGRRPGADCSVV